MFLLLLACTADSPDTGVDDTAEPSVDEIDADQDGSPADLDCDDNDPQAFPGAAEVCDGVDNDCDGEVDNAATDAVDYWVDQDQDGFGGGDATAACEQPPNTATQGGDCLDSDPSVNPDAQEICDDGNVDQDCDGLADDEDDSVDPAGYASFYEDRDADGLGDPDALSMSCDAGVGQVANDLDCDDSDASVGEQCPGWDGSYTGTFSVTASVPDLGVSDTCSGTTEIEVVESDKTQITGTVDCSFSGVLASLIGADWTATITGGFDSEDTALGDLELTGLITYSWEGEFVDNTLTGNLSGSTSYEGFKVSYSGGFEVSR